MVSELSGIVKAKTLRSWNLSANNLEESVRFWRDLLGAEERNRHQVGGVDVARLDLGGFGIGLFDASGGERPGVPHHTVGIDGPADPDLSAVGRAQAERTADFLAGSGVDHIVASPMRRAAQTAAPLAARLGLIPATIAGLPEYDHVLVDGLKIRGIEDHIGPYTAIVHGDASSYAIACASVIAKVTRDRLMARLALRYPGYGWERNAGYATPDHVAGLREHGVTPVHRRTYQRIRSILAGEQLILDLAGESISP